MPNSVLGGTSNSTKAAPSRNSRLATSCSILLLLHNNSANKFSCIKMAASAEQLFRFQFSAYAVELPSASACSEDYTSVTLAFRLFDFPSVLLRLQRTQASVEALQVENSPQRSGIERWRVRGGKSCLFSMPIEQLKSLSEISHLYVMLTRLKSASSGGDAAGDHLLAASIVSLKSLVETCLAEATPSRHKHSVLLYRGSQLYAKAHVTLSLQCVQVAAEKRRGTTGVESRSDGATEQSNRMRRVTGTHQQVEDLSHAVGPPAMLFRACRPMHQPAPQEGPSGTKTSLISCRNPVSAETCSATNTAGRKIVWPNGYIEEVVCDEVVMAAADPLPTTTSDTGTIATSSLEDNRYPVLQALLKELSVIKSHSQEVQFQEHHTEVVAPELSDKCLQTEECCVQASSPPTSGRVQLKANKPSPQKPFVRTCCAIKHVPSKQATAVKKPRQAKPLQTPLPSKTEVLPADSKQLTALMEGQSETSAVVQLPAARTPPSEGSVCVVGVSEVQRMTPLYTEVPTTKEALTELIRVNSHQGLSPVQEGDSKEDRSTSTGSRVDKSDSHVDSRSYRSDSHTDSRDRRGDDDDRSDSIGHKSDRHPHRSSASSNDKKGHQSQDNSSADNSAGEPRSSTQRPSHQIKHFVDGNTSIDSRIHPTNINTLVQEDSDSAAVLQQIHSGNGGGQRNESLQPPSSPHVFRCDSETVKSYTGYSVDSLEDRRRVDTPTGLSSDLGDSYTEDFESGSDFSQDQKSVSNSDWNQGRLYSPVPVEEEERSNAIVSTASRSSSTLHTTDQ